MMYLSTQLKVGHDNGYLSAADHKYTKYYKQVPKLRI